MFFRARSEDIASAGFMHTHHNDVPDVLRLGLIEFGCWVAKSAGVGGGWGLRPLFTGAGGFPGRCVKVFHAVLFLGMSLIRG